MILQASTSFEAEKVQQAYEALNNNIALFIENYDIAYQKINIFQERLKTIIKRWHKIKNSIKRKDENYKDSSQYQNYLEERKSFMQESFTNDLQETFLNLYLLAFKIQQYLNAALGQEVVTAYVFQEQGNIAPKVLLSTNMKDFLKVEVSSSGNLILRYRENQENLNNHVQSLKQITNNDDTNYRNYQKLAITYNKAHKRYRNFPLKKKRGSYVLWLYPYGGQKWNGAYVSSFGSVNEAYAYFLFNLDNFNPSNILEEDMEIFMDYLINKITNESGMLAGDFQNGIMEVAVKSADASALGIKQIYNLAKKIKEKTNNFQEIVSFLEKQKKKNENNAKPINKSLKSALQNIADKHIEPAIKNAFEQKS